MKILFLFSFIILSSCDTLNHKIIGEWVYVENSATQDEIFEKMKNWKPDTLMIKPIIYSKNQYFSEHDDYIDYGKWSINSFDSIICKITSSQDVFCSKLLFIDENFLITKKVKSIEFQLFKKVNKKGRIPRNVIKDWTN